MSLLLVCLTRVIILIVPTAEGHRGGLLLSVELRPSGLSIFGLIFSGLTFGCLSSTGTSVMKVTASDADDPTYGSSARVVYSVLEGEKFFTVDKHTGKIDKKKANFYCSSSFPFHNMCNLANYDITAHFLREGKLMS